MELKVLRFGNPSGRREAILQFMRAHSAEKKGDFESHAARGNHKSHWFATLAWLFDWFVVRTSNRDVPGGVLGVERRR